MLFLHNLLIEMEKDSLDVIMLKKVMERLENLLEVFFIVRKDAISLETVPKRAHKMVDWMVN